MEKGVGEEREGERERGGGEGVMVNTRGIPKVTVNVSFISNDDNKLISFSHYALVVYHC